MSAKTQAAPAKAASKKKPTKGQMAKAEQLFGKDAVLEQPKDEHTITEDQRKGERRSKGNEAMNFAVQQLSAPQAPQPAEPAQPAQAPATPQLATPPVLTMEFQKALEELQTKFNIPHGTVRAVGPAGKQASAPKAPKPEKVQQNGITRPAAATVCGKIWAAADEISAQVHGVAPIALLKKHPAVIGQNDHTVKTQYARWRTYNGIAGRLPTIQAVHEEVKPWNPSFGIYDKF